MGQKFELEKYRSKMYTARELVEVLFDKDLKDAPICAELRETAARFLIREFNEGIEGTITVTPEQLQEALQTELPKKKTSSMWERASETKKQEMPT